MIVKMETKARANVATWEAWQYPSKCNRSTIKQKL